MGEGMAPMMTAPAASSAPATSPRVRRWTSGSRITPRPRDASTLPASNCGLTRITIGAPGAATSPTSTGTARVTEMNERSAVDQVDRRPAHRGQGHVADVQALVAGHPGVLPEPLVELAVAHVDGDDRRRRRPGGGSR